MSASYRHIRALCPAHPRGLAAQVLAISSNSRNSSSRLVSDHLACKAKTPAACPSGAGSPTLLQILGPRIRGASCRLSKHLSSSNASDGASARHPAVHRASPKPSKALAHSSLSGSSSRAALDRNRRRSSRWCSRPSSRPPSLSRSPLAGPRILSRPRARCAHTRDMAYVTQEFSSGGACQQNRIYPLRGRGLASTADIVDCVSSGICRSAGGSQRPCLRGRPSIRVE